MDDSIKFHLDRRKWRNELSPKRKDTRSEIDIADFKLKEMDLQLTVCGIVMEYRSDNKRKW
ncbi:MAG: hypothetical protein RTU30_07785 [Candidatus Thorarchaeota archaeon]